MTWPKETEKNNREERIIISSFIELMSRRFGGTTEFATWKNKVLPMVLKYVKEDIASPAEIQMYQEEQERKAKEWKAKNVSKHRITSIDQALSILKRIENAESKEERHSGSTNL